MKKLRKNLTRIILAVFILTIFVAAGNSKGLDYSSDDPVWPTGVEGESTV